jgi:hypothetical protein
MLKRLLLFIAILLFIPAVAMAQDIEVEKYTISVRIDPAANSLDTRASLEITNRSATPKDRLYFRLTKLGKVSVASVNGAGARIETSDDRRVNALNQIIVIPTTPLAAGASAKVDFTYLIEAQDSTPTAAVTPGEVLMTPEAVWFPMPSTMFTMYGATTAPFNLTITTATGTTNLRGFSAGEQKSVESGVTFDQALNSLPFFVAGNLDRAISAEHGGVKVEIVIQTGLVAGTVDQEGSAGPTPGVVAKLSEETGKVIAFLTKTLGPPPAGSSLRIISSTRTGNLAVPGALVLGEQTLRRDVINSSTLEWLADSVARMWIDGRVKIRGQDARPAQGGRPAQKAKSTALIRDSLPRYLAAMYLEERFGPNAAVEAFQHMRDAYTPVAISGRDAELGVQTILSPTYGAASFSKGPLVLRLVAETIGREKFLTAVRAFLVAPATKLVTTDDLKAELVKAGGNHVEKLFQQWIETIVEPDLVIGIPVATDNPNIQRVNLRNLGNGDVTTKVLAITASGKQMTSTAVVPSEDLASVDIQTGEKITSVEVDPDKLIIQTNYDNDIKPARTSAQTLLNESIIAFTRGEFSEAEKKLREAIATRPHNSLAHAWLSRALAAQNKTDEAVNAANAAIRIEPPVGSALAWAHFTLGQVAQTKGNSAEAIAHLRRALVEAEEAPAQFAIREALVKNERGKSTPDEAVRAFIVQLDQAIKQPSSDQLFTMVVRNNLKRFVQGITVTPPTAWVTEILRVDKVDSDRVALDVSIKAIAGGREQSGTAVYILHRTGRGLMLEDVQLFNVK